MSRLFTSGGQIIGTWASASVVPMNIQGWFPLGLTHLISLLSKGLWRVFSSTTVQKHNSLGLSLLYGPTVTGKDIALTIWNFVSKVMSLLFNMLSMFVITFLPRSNHLSPLGDFCLFCYKSQLWVDGLLGFVSLPGSYPPSGWLWSWDFHVAPGVLGSLGCLQDFSFMVLPTLINILHHISSKKIYFIIITLTK